MEKNLRMKNLRKMMVMEVEYQHIMQKKRTSLKSVKII